MSISPDRRKQHFIGFKEHKFSNKFTGRPQYKALKYLQCRLLHGLINNQPFGKNYLNCPLITTKI